VLLSFGFALRCLDVRVHHDRQTGLGLGAQLTEASQAAQEQR
jgi:hypothetical protein